MSADHIPAGIRATWSRRAPLRMIVAPFLREVGAVNA
jgi:hypothetical protein